MACNSIALNGITAHCDSAPGGLKEVYIAEASDVSALTYDESDNNISKIEMTTGKKFKKYTFRPGNCSFTSTFTSDQTTGSAYWTSELSLVFTKADSAKRLEIYALVTDDVVAIAQDKAGNFILIGDENPVNATAGTHETGTASSDKNAYSLTLSSESAQPPHFVDASIMSALVE